MDIFGSIIGAGASIFGTMMGAQTADKQMAFQQMMSSTAYQRASADMKAAGLNPMMMFGSGGPASTPPGAMNPNLGGINQAGDILSKAIPTALQNNVLRKTIDVMTTDIAKKEAETKLTGQQTQTEEQATGTEFAKKILTANQADLAELAKNPAWLESFKAKLGMEFYDTPFGRALYKAGLGGSDASKVISPAVDVISTAKGFRAPGVGSGYGDRSFSDRFTGAPEAPVSSAKQRNRAETSDPGFVPKGIRERAYRSVHPNN